MRLQKNRKPLSLPQKLFFVGIIFLLSWLISRASTEEDGRLETSATMQELFETALEPMGSTMYVWGGGWDSDNACAGRSARQIGVSAKWEKFANVQDADYDFEEHRYEAENGLDCSGYVGWVLYNLFESKDGRAGYVTFSTEMAEEFASRGWGRLIKNPQVFLPGDIVSMEGHVWISLGTCADGSVLLMHSSPPGVSVCGTIIPGSLESDTTSVQSIAVQLATEYMSKHYPNWQEKYPNRTVSDTYLENVTILRWNSKTLEDAKEYQSLSGEEVIDLL